MSFAKFLFGLLVLFGITFSPFPAMAANDGNAMARQSKSTTFLSGSTEDSLYLIHLMSRAFRLIEENSSPQVENKFFKIIDTAMAKAGTPKYLTVVGEQINKIGAQMRNEARYALAIRLHKKALEIGKATGNKHLMMLSCNDLGVVYRRIDSYQKAMEYHLKALRLANETKDSVSMAMAVNSIGNVYLMLENYSKALQYFKKSLRLEQNRKNPIGIAINLNNIAHVYEAKGQLDKALKYYELSLDINRNIHSKRGIAINSNNIASLLSKQGKYQDALAYSKKAIRLAGIIKDYENLAYAYIQTGALYSALKKYNQAFEYLAPGIALAKRIQARSILEKGYNTLFNTYLGMKKYEEAINYLKLKQAYHDSLINLEVKKNIARLQIQFDTERQKNEIQLEQQKTKIAQLQLKKQRYLLYFTWSAVAILLIILAFVSFYLYNKNRQNILLLEKTKALEAAQKELEKTNRSLQEAIKKAENSARAKTNFLANISHEIRTPLNSVIGFSDLLFSLTNDEKQKSYLQTIKSSGESLLALINDILDLSKIEEGNINLEFKETNIRKIVEDVFSIFSLEAAEKGLHLLTEVEENVPANLIFEEARLRQILLNLVGNAIKFTTEGSITIHVYARPEEKSDKLTLTVEVIDTGPGISPEDQETIFMPFHQAHTAQKTQGAGLGLSITQRLVKAMNGEIKLVSSPGKGSRFVTVFHNVTPANQTGDSHPEDLVSDNIRFKKCLFISEPHPLKKSILQILLSRGFQAEDTGLNLSQAKKVLKNFRLVIFCCLEKEILQNIRNIFEKENLDKRYVFLILNTSEDFPINPVKAASISLHKLSDKEIKQALRSFLQQFEEEETARQLFHAKKPNKDKTFFTKLQQIYEEDFSEAFKTKMFDKIALFVQHIKELSASYGLDNLETYARELDRHLTDFDIVFIEQQMRIFQKAYEVTTGNL